MTSMTPTTTQRISTTKTCNQAERTLQIGSMHSMNFIAETRLMVKPDNTKLTRHSKERHCSCILPPINAASNHGSTGMNNNIMLQLIEATNRNNEVCK